ncbi:MAG: gamma-glutamylcyclotransferase [Candidatus Binatia bacterium]
MPLLFAYGTLIDPVQRAAVLQGAPSHVLGTGTVCGALYDLGAYPALVEGGASGRVPGVLIELPDASALARLDEYEGVAENLYRRSRAPVRLEDGHQMEAWVYWYCGSVEGLQRIDVWRPA